jgi:hypothetical protein
MKLITDPNLPDPDEFYARLIAAHKGLSPGESAALNAELVLILCNHIGNPDIIDQALALARK